MARAFAEITFTPSVKAAQKRYGGDTKAQMYLTDDIDPRLTFTDKERAFIAERDGFYLATVAENDWPYVQFRGGPKGFLHVLDERTLAWADFRGNRQYLSAGNLSTNDRVAMFLMDYANRRRLKVWGRARVVDVADGPDLAEQLFPDGYRAVVERSIVVSVEAFDWNCTQHIAERLTAEEWAASD